jgi:hypothetical protein
MNISDPQPVSVLADGKGDRNKTGARGHSS